MMIQFMSHREREKEREIGKTENCTIRTPSYDEALLAIEKLLELG